VKPTVLRTLSASFAAPWLAACLLASACGTGDPAPATPTADVLADATTVEDVGTDLGAAGEDTDTTVEADVLDVASPDADDAGNAIDASEDIADLADASETTPLDVGDQPDTPPDCVPACDGKNCGQDGCGGVCGYCDGSAPVCLEGVCQEYCPTCALTGTVYAPEGTIPIRGAVVWATLTPPEPFPSTNFCDTCVDLPVGTPFGISGASGEFKLPIPSAGPWYIVVQKGTFRRVRKLDVTAGMGALPKAYSTLPATNDATLGDQIPSMAVVIDSFDQIENTLAKLGLGELDSYGDLELASASFDTVISDEASDFFSDGANLAKYQIIFMPCDSAWFFPALEDPVVLGTIREWVAAGGRLYVTDWSYDILKRTFPEPIQWMNDDGSQGSARLSGSFDGASQVLDPGLSSWLTHQGLAAFDLLANWTIIDTVSDYTAPDVDGTPTLMKPKIWMYVQTEDDGPRPATVTFQYGCGRGLFSTYHTEDGETFLPQEKTLAYILFEVSVCADTKYGD
jgi:hypothetical protein